MGKYTKVCRSGIRLCRSFAGPVSVREFMHVAVISLIGGVAVCLATGDFAIELSWVATPLIVIIGSFALAGRRATATPTGGRS
jgi:hypothetical protein